MSVAISVPVHVPVLLEEVITALQPRPGGRFVDCTVGLGGHAAAILEKISPSGRLLGIDADPHAIRVSKDRLGDHGDAVTLVNGNFTDLEAICKRYHIHPVDGILLDIGVSSLQLDTAERGFSFHLDAPLDMRFNPEQGLTASDIVNRFSEKELAKLIERYGEERHSRRIARHIVQNRPVATTAELAQSVEQALVASARRGRIHPLVGRGCSMEKSGSVYECIRCGARVTSDELELRGGETKCIVCGYRILKKIKPPVVKRIQAK